jgi:hypothetical protein
MSVLGNLGIGVPIYERGAGGIPTTTVVTDLAGRIDGCELTSVDQFGFESFRCPFVCRADEALDWLINGLMRSTVVYGPDGQIIWEGAIEQIDATFGQEKRSVSLRDMANRLTVRYTTVLGTPGTTGTASDTASQALYGVKDMVLPVDQSDSNEAGYYRTVELARRKNPLMTPSTEIATGDQGGVQIELTFAGWYAFLDWLLTANTSTIKTQTTTQLTALLAAYNAVNAFLSTSATNIAASGINVSEFIAPDTSYRVKIEDLLKRGNGTNPYAWGIYEGRQFSAGVWAGATPTTITYQRSFGSADVFDTNGLPVPFWDVRPNAMYGVIDLLDPGPVATAQDSAARFYVARTSLQIGADGMRLALEPSESRDLAAILVRKYGGQS